MFKLFRAFMQEQASLAKAKTPTNNEALATETPVVVAKQFKSMTILTCTYVYVDVNRHVCVRMELAGEMWNVKLYNLNGFLQDKFILTMPKYMTTTGRYRDHG